MIYTQELLKLPCICGQNHKKGFMENNYKYRLYHQLNRIQLPVLLKLSFGTHCFLAKNGSDISGERIPPKAKQK